MAKPRQIPVNVRLAPLLIARTDRMRRPLAAARPDLAPSGVLSRSDVLRLAILRGLYAIQAEVGK